MIAPIKYVGLSISWSKGGRSGKYILQQQQQQQQRQYFCDEHRRASSPYPNCCLVRLVRIAYVLRMSSDEVSDRRLPAFDGTAHDDLNWPAFTRHNKSTNKQDPFLLFARGTASSITWWLLSNSVALLSMAICLQVITVRGGLLQRIKRYPFLSSFAEMWNGFIYINVKDIDLPSTTEIAGILPDEKDTGKSTVYFDKPYLLKCWCNRLLCPHLGQEINLAPMPLWCLLHARWEKGTLLVNSPYQPRSSPREGCILLSGFRCPSCELCTIRL